MQKLVLSFALKTPSDTTIFQLNFLARRIWHTDLTRAARKQPALPCALESLDARFQLLQKDYQEAETHDEKVQLTIIAKEIVKEYRTQIAEYKRKFQRTQ
jgi:hypothetical protein